MAFALVATLTACTSNSSQLPEADLYVSPGQLFALGLCLARGMDPDAPRGLRKVTLTR